MSLLIPVYRRTLRPLRAIDVQARARVAVECDCRTDIKVNDTLLASGLRVGGQPCTIFRDPPFQLDICHAFRDGGRALPSSTPRWAVHAATTAQVPH